jgi:monovalent cation/proton antiporter MnhG/PhaG subunit
LTPRGVAVAILLAVGVGVELFCCVGVLVMRDLYDKLHYTAPATTIGSLAIAAAVVVQESFSQAGIKAILVFLILLVTNPVLSHATARAARVRELGHWEPRPRRRRPRRDRGQEGVP